MEENIIELNQVSIKFNLALEKSDTLKEWLIRFAKRELMYKEFIALKNISLKIKKGDVVGLIGKNGSGKSTVCKLVAGVLKPSQGEVLVKGAVAPLIELGAGFDNNLTARENIYLNGAILGQDRKYMTEHFQSIIDFAELENFVDVPLKKFSSGMRARLGFAIATEVQAEILVVDEVLAVGDAAFKEKCIDRIENMIRSGMTILFVSHIEAQVKRICTRGIWLNAGEIKYDGSVDEAFEKYNSLGKKPQAKN